MLLEDLEQRHAATQARWSEIEASFLELDQARASAAGGDPAALSPDDRVDMNVGGLPLSIRRGVLTAVEGSKLAAAFGPRWFGVLPRDREGRVFVDEDPVVFRAVVDALADVEASGGANRRSCGGPQVPPFKSRYLEAFLQEWGLNSAFACDREAGNDKHSEEKKEMLPSPTEKRDPARLLQEVVQALEEEERGLEAEVQRLKAAQRSLEEEPAFFARHIGEKPRPVAYVSVGGRARAVAVHVGCGGMPESVLGRLFASDTWQLQKKDLDDMGNYRLYVDLAAFDKLLELMRLRVLYGLSDAKVDLMGREADKLAALARYLFPGQHEHVLSGFRWAGSSKPNNACHPTRSHTESQILSPALAVVLQGMFPGRRMTLIYRATRDGRSASRFHHLCDHRGPTVTLIRTEDGMVFGGFTAVSWQGVVPKADPSAFLFTLINPHKLPPQQLRPSGEQPEHAVCTHSMFGPTWGSGYDLRVNEDMASGSSNLGRNYCMPGVRGYGSSFDSHTLLAGSPNFKIAEVEVFLVQKAMFW